MYMCQCCHTISWGNHRHSFKKSTVERKLIKTKRTYRTTNSAISQNPNLTNSYYISI